MESTEKLNLIQPERPQFNLIKCSMAGPIMMAKEITPAAKFPLSVISSFHMFGSNLYRLCSNGSIERMLSLKHGQWMRIKKQLKNARLVDYEGNYGDGWKPLIARWEEYNSQKWSYPI